MGLPTFMSAAETGFFFTFSHEIITRMTNSTLCSLVLRRTHVIHEPCMWPSSPRALGSSVVRASYRCAEGHRLNSGRGLRFFLCPNQNVTGLTLGLQQKSGPLLSILVLTPKTAQLRSQCSPFESFSF